MFLVGSGLCGLIYQMVWFQQLKLIFGTSTAASAAVVAIFMGGLGFGSLWLGRRSDAHERPMSLYGKLEVGIALCAAASPLLMALVRDLYLATGGTTALGGVVATWLRGALALLVLGLPTFLMGGTFPAMARAVTSDQDTGRPVLGLLYGANTVGAVLGVLAGTFVCLEWFGLQQTLWLTAAINLGLGLLAWAWGACLPAIPPEPASEGATTEVAAPAPDTRPASSASHPNPAPSRHGDPDPDDRPTRPAATERAALASLLGPGAIAAFMTGAIFFFMEMVWYRMLAPLLGGSTYSFGLILAMALAGIGSGGLLFAGRATGRPAGLPEFAGVTALGMLLLMVPYALGDRLAILTGLLSSLDLFGFPGKLFHWTLIAGLVVFPASVISGYQFPMLLSLVGQGRRDIGRQVGLLYAANTLGAIVGALAGGFGLLSLLSAPSCWKFAGLLSGLLVIGLVGLALRREGFRLGTLVPLALAGAALALMGAEGPTAVWRHSNVGFGRVALHSLDATSLREWMNLQRRMTIWERDGKESSVALTEANGLAFSLNGKVDGNSLADAPTQIMLGMVSALTHPAPRQAFVVGLGTGCSAGWLAAVPDMEKVVVAELEPLVFEVASRCAPINHDVLRHPKVEVRLGDARELLLTDRQTYDLIVSEPSNPFRAGIASLFTREFYQAAARRLRPGGIFSQWVQGYEIDVETMRIIYATLHSVFPHIETWQTSDGDLLLLCTQERLAHSRARLEQRLAGAPWKDALWQGWRAIGVEGYFSHYQANADFAHLVATRVPAHQISTDDRMTVEFGLLRTMGKKNLGMMRRLRSEAYAQGLHRPPLQDGQLDWEEVQNQALLFLTLGEIECRSIEDPDKGYLQRVAAHTSFCREDFANFLKYWKDQPRPPAHPGEFLMLGEAFARYGAEEALGMLEPARAAFPGEAWLIEAMYHHKIGSFTRAFDCLEQGLDVFRHRPFPVKSILRRGLETAMNMGLQAPSLAPRIAALLRPRFLLSAENEVRVQALAGLLPKLPAALTAEICAEFEPFVPWNEDFLTARVQAYRELNHPRLRRAEADLAELQAANPAGPHGPAFLQ
jgi:spermidine synthase